MCALALLAVLSAAGGVGSWELTHTSAVTTVERRTHPDGFYEIRVSTLTEVSGDQIADAYWNEREKSLSTMKKYLVLSRTQSEKVAYLQLHLPIVKDRDYTIRIAREADPQAGLYQFNGRCVSDVGPPPSAEHIRVSQCTAQLTIEPTADGRTRVTYAAFANPGGQLPRWLVNTVAPKAAVEVLEKLITIARERRTPAVSKAD